MEFSFNELRIFITTFLWPPSGEKETTDKIDMPAMAKISLIDIVQQSNFFLKKLWNSTSNFKFDFPRVFFIKELVIIVQAFRSSKLSNMKQIVSASFCFLSMLIVLTGEKIPLMITDNKVLKEAEFALVELQKLSDSGVYQSLSISRIISAQEESSYYKSGKAVEVFQIVVMNHKEDGAKSFAIDEFPLMKDDAIEEFWIRKVEEKRRLREETFRRMELESILLQYTTSPQSNGNNDNGLDGNGNVEDQYEDEENDDGYVDSLLDEDLHDAKEALSQQCVEYLMGEVDQLEEGDAERIRRHIESREMQLRLVEPYIQEEFALSSMTLRQLYDITSGKVSTATDYQKYRAQQVLDQSMIRLRGNRMSGSGTRTKSGSTNRREEL
eukprot:gene7215-14712_t